MGVNGEKKLALDIVEVQINGKKKFELIIGK